MKYGRYQKNMTDGMLEECLHVDVMAGYELELCITSANRCAALVCDLPMTAESGESVTHGANMSMLDLVDYWVTRLRLLESKDLMDTYAFREAVYAHELHPIVERKLRGI